jgi:ribonuclease VapC
VKLAVDASALLAILFREGEAQQYSKKLLEAQAAWISPVNWWEVHVRAFAHLGATGESEADALMTKLGVQVEPVTLEHAREALSAFRRYRGRPARLNMGDCFAYALAKAKGVPLLYKGSDFAATDIAAA